MRTKARFLYFFLLIFFLQTVLVSVVAAATRIMPLGDSITNGNNSGVVPEEPDFYVSYRKALREKLVAAGYDVDFVGGVQSGWAEFDDPDHEGHPGWHAGGETEGGLAANIYTWLGSNPADVVLLHIGTNDINNGGTPAETAAEVRDILNEIDRFSEDTWVVLALIVNQACCNEEPQCLTECTDTTDFNDLVYDMAVNRINDKIIIVDMELESNIIYRYSLIGDMFNDDLGGIHPFETGYAKMATVWFSALEEILPDPDPDPDPDPPNKSSDSGCFIGTITE
jgi:lysophospholipase L1-like esterase